MLCIEPLALWTHDIERLRAFYCEWFGATANARYESRNTPGFATGDGYHEAVIDDPDGNPVEVTA